MKQHKQFSFAAKVWLILSIIICALIVIWGLRLVLEGKKFKLTENEVDRVVQVAKSNEPDGVVEKKNSCSRARLKLKEGLRSCVIVATVYYQTEDIDTAIKTADKLEAALSRAVHIDKQYPSQHKDEINTLKYTFMNKTCFMSFYYRDSGSIYLPDHIRGNSNLVVNISCSGSALWDYYPRSDKL